MVDKTYAHLYPNKGDQIARELDKHKDGFADSLNNDLYGSKPDIVNVNDMEPKIRNMCNYSNFNAKIMPLK